jgi:alpha-glucosidase
LGHKNALDFFVLTGEDLPALRRTFMELVGRPPVPPKSIFSPWIVDGPKPASVSWVDHFKSIRQLVKGPDSLGLVIPSLTDNPPVADAKDNNLELMNVETPYLSRDSTSFDDMEKRGFLVKNSDSNGRALILDYQGKPSALIDYTDPGTATYWHSLRRAASILAGTRTFLLTGGEPESYSSLAWYKGTGSVDEHSHYAWGSRFILKWLDGFRLGLANQRFIRGESPRLFLLSRAGLVGLSRFGAGIYTLEPNIFYPLGAGQARAHLTLSGIDYYSTDITPMLTDWPLDKFNQIYEAWLSKNIFVNLPFLMPRAMLDQPWAWPNLKLKAQLQPYYYSLAHQAHQNGEPIVSPLLYHFQEDAPSRERAFETMVGPFLLVAAGVNPGDELLSFHLPQGRWYDLHGRDVIEQDKSGQTILPCKLNGFHVPPMLLKAGSIIPTWNDPESEDRRLLIKAFPTDEPTSFTLYEDNGLNINYQRGEFLKTVFELSPKQSLNSYTLTIKAREGELPGSVTSRNFYIEFVGLGNIGSALLDGDLYNRVANENELDEIEAGWFSIGTGRLFFKTPLLDLSKDHVIQIG